MLRNSRRIFFEWDSRLTEGKPAITGSLHAFVSKTIPVVMLQDVPGVGQKGEIVNVSRGRARNDLVPKKLAVFGTVWENIDEYADPLLIERARILHAKDNVTRKLPFDWINEITLKFIKSTESAGNLRQAVTVLEILKQLSDREELDVLPSDLTLPQGCEEGLRNVGTHKVDLKLAFRGWTGSYSFNVEIVSLEVFEEAERKERELLQAKSRKKIYGLPTDQIE